MQPVGQEKPVLSHTYLMLKLSKQVELVYPLQGESPVTMYFFAACTRLQLTLPLCCSHAPPPFLFFPDPFLLNLC